MNVQASTARVHGLDTLRAIAIMLVYVYHYMVFVSNTPTFSFWSQVGWVGVDLFFALSGYLIGNQIFAALRSERGFSLKNFYARRLLRTLPNFYVVLALYYLVPWVRGDAPLLPVWKFLTFTQNYMLTPGTAFSHAWSLCIEEQFYMLLPAVALLVAAWRRPLAWGWLAVGASFALGMLIRAQIWEGHVDANPQGIKNYYKMIYYSTFCRFDELVAGVALALLKNYHPRAWRRLTAHGNAVLALGVAACALTFYLFVQFHFGYAMTVFGYPMLALSFALMIVAALSPGSLLHRTRIPGAASLALWSYAIYLTHKQVCILASKQLLQYGWGPDSMPTVLLTIALSVLAGWILYRLVETPFMRMRQRFVPGMDAAPRPSAPLQTS